MVKSEGARRRDERLRKIDEEEENEDAEISTEYNKAIIQRNEATAKKKEAYNSLGQKAIFHEVLKVSRKPNSEEKAAVDNLKDKLGLGDDYEVRFMDYEPLLEEMGLHKDEKDKLLGFLRAGKGNKEVIEYIEKYLDECDYVVDFISDPKKECSLTRDGLKNEVMSHTLEGCKKSTTCQKAFLTLIARTKMPQTFLSTRIAHDGSCLYKYGRLSFRTSDSPKSALDKIEYNNYNNKEHYFQSLHDGPSKIKNLLNGLFIYLYYINKTLSHEGGHSISGDLIRFASTEATMEIISKLVTRRCNHDKSSDFFKALLSETQEFLKKNPRIANELELKSSAPLTAGWAKNLFSNAMEVFQIMGLAVFEDGNGRKLLEVNPFCDFAISAELGKPIRWGHTDVEYDTTFKYSKTNAYNALFPVYHSSTWKYETKLTINKYWDNIKSGWNWGCTTISNGWNRLFQSKKVKGA